MADVVYLQKKQQNSVYAVSFLVYTIIIGIALFLILKVMGPIIKMSNGDALLMQFVLWIIVVAIVVVTTIKVDNIYKQYIESLSSKEIILKKCSPRDRGLCKKKNNIGKLFKISVICVLLAVISGSFIGNLLYIADKEHLIKGNGEFKIQLFGLVIFMAIALMALVISMLILIAKVEAYYEIVNLKKQTILIRKDVYNKVILGGDESGTSQSYIEITGGVLKQEGGFISILIIGKGIISINVDSILSIYNKQDDILMK